jgi:hypothetical protein
VGGKNSGISADPIAEWFTVVGADIFATHYSQRQQDRDTRNAELISAMFGQNALVSHTAEDGTPLTNVESASAQTGRNKIMQKYGTFYCAKIVRFLYVILCDLERAAHRAGLEVPSLDEFFFPFMNDDRYLLSRKTFPPRGQ